MTSPEPKPFSPVAAARSRPADGAPTPARARLASDIGGTFTDVVLETANQRYSCKVLTTPRQPELAVLEGIARLLAESGVAPGDVGLMIHGTTLATNALIERKGARTALLTTQGFRDVLEMGYEKRYEQYDVNIERAPELVPRPLRFTVAERMAADGQVLLALDEAGVEAAAQQMRQAGVQAVAIGFIHGHAWPVHEQRAGDIVAAVMGPEITVCLSSQVCPEMREYERFSTTCANAYVRPLMARYLSGLRQRMDTTGLACPLLLMMSGGGLTTLDQARRFPIRLVESGPAGGAILAAQLAREGGLGEVMAFDMGGTTAKLCLISQGQPERARRFEIGRIYRNLKGSGLPVRIPVIELVEIGAGGGSIARVDAMSRITVGPDSAGAEPGPACYGRGGLAATVTDANLVLGRIDGLRFAAGRMALDVQAAGAALRCDVGQMLGMCAGADAPGSGAFTSAPGSGDAPSARLTASAADRRIALWAAAGVSEIVEENMANAARVHAIERGKSIRDCSMVAFGGAAPLHAARLATKLGIGRVLVPAGAGVGSAIGFLRAPIAFEVVRSDHGRLLGSNAAVLNDRLQAMEGEARAVVTPAALALGVDPTALQVERLAELRYEGQGHELSVQVPAGTLNTAGLQRLCEAFEAAYERVYGLRIGGSAVEAVTWSVSVSTAASALQAAPASMSTPAAPSTLAGPAPSSPPGPLTTAAQASRQRQVFNPELGEVEACDTHWRFDLPVGARVIGPALVAEHETTTVVPAGWVATVAAAGHLLLETLQ